LPGTLVGGRRAWSTRAEMESSGGDGAAPEPMATEPSVIGGSSSGGSKTTDGTSADYYFNSYAHFGIHEEMLKDTVRTKTYMKSIYDNKHLFRDKVVLDVGCGTGILCMFAAKAGAKQVIGVDCSDIIEQSKKIVAQNVAETGLPDVITLVKGKMEDVVLPVEQVDIIISEWMGYFLFYESMLDTVLVARDKYLAPGGLVFPDKATLYISAIEDGDYKAEKMDWWDDVYGFKMSALKELAYVEPIVDVVDPRQVVTDAVPILTIDVQTCTVADLDFTAKFELTSQYNDHVHAFLGYFDTVFSHSHRPLVLPTGPEHKSTHWKQTVFYLRDPITCKEGEKISGELRCSPNKDNHRDLDIDIAVNFDGVHTKMDVKHEYKLR